MPFDQLDIDCATTLRLLAIDTVQQANSGHPGFSYVYYLTSTYRGFVFL